LVSTSAINSVAFSVMIRNNSSLRRMDSSDGFGYSLRLGFRRWQTPHLVAVTK